MLDDRRSKPLFLATNALINSGYVSKLKDQQTCMCILKGLLCFTSVTSARVLLAVF